MAVWKHGYEHEIRISQFQFIVFFCVIVRSRNEKGKCEDGGLLSNEKKGVWWRMKKVFFFFFYVIVAVVVVVSRKKRREKREKRYKGMNMIAVVVRSCEFLTL